MTHIEDTGRFGITIRGHAGYDIHGKDIVCAGESAIACALGEYLIANKDHCTDLDIVVEDGYIAISVTPNTDFEARCESAFEVARCGLAAIEKDYPKNVIYSKKYL